MKKQDEINLFAMLLERERRAKSARGHFTGSDIKWIDAWDMGNRLGIPFKRVEYITRKWHIQGWWDSLNEYPFGYIIGKLVEMTDPGDKPCAKFPTTLEAYAGGPVETSVDVIALLEALMTEAREARLKEEQQLRRQRASFDAFMKIAPERLQRQIEALKSPGEK
jgi:hypothetical protein